MVQQMHLIGDDSGPHGVFLDEENAAPGAAQTRDDFVNLLNDDGASPSEGSSSISTRPEAISPRPMPTIRRSPPDKVRAIWL